MADWPTIFQPLQLRSGARYRSLERYAFSGEEMIWACIFLSGRFHDQQNRIQLSQFAERYSLDDKLLREWLNQHERGELLYGPTEGVAPPPMYVDDVAVAAINDFPSTRGVTECQEEYEGRFTAFLDRQLRDTRARRPHS